MSAPITPDHMAFHQAVNDSERKYISQPSVVREPLLNWLARRLLQPDVAYSIRKKTLPVEVARALLLEIFEELLHEG